MDFFAMACAAWLYSAKLDCRVEYTDNRSLCAADYGDNLWIFEDPDALPVYQACKTEAKQEYLKCLDESYAGMGCD